MRERIRCGKWYRHRWQPIGGLRENPGYMGIGGTAIAYTERCACGVFRCRVFGDVNACCNRNHGWEYSQAETN